MPRVSPVRRAPQDASDVVIGVEAAGTGDVARAVERTRLAKGGP